MTAILNRSTHETKAWYWWDNLKGLFQEQDRQKLQG